jgi:hypothetical protein
MDAMYNWNGQLKLAVPKALRRSHDEARAEFARATMDGGPIARAVTRVAQLCRPHFEYEEKAVFPVLALLPDLERGKARPEMMNVMPLIRDFRSKREATDEHHQSILGAIDELLRAAHNKNSREFAEFAYALQVHEKIEDEVIYPSVVLIGNYLEKTFTNSP